jgi:hypothetical protein
VHPRPDEDLEHLRLLSIFHYVYAAFKALFACLPLIYLLMGSFLVAAGTSGKASGGPPLQIIGGVIAVIGGVLSLLGWALAGCIFFAGRCLATRTHRTFCIVVAALCCPFMPLGTALGVFSLVVLTKPRVRQLFEGG